MRFLLPFQSFPIDTKRVQIMLLDLLVYQLPSLRFFEEYLHLTVRAHLIEEPAQRFELNYLLGLLDRRTVSPIPRLDTALGPNVDTTPVLVGETRVAAERTGKENASLVVMPIASQVIVSNALFYVSSDMFCDRVPQVTHFAPYGRSTHALKRQIRLKYLFLSQMHPLRNASLRLSLPSILLMNS